MSRKGIARKVETSGWAFAIEWLVNLLCVLRIAVFVEEPSRTGKRSGERMVGPAFVCADTA